MQCACGPIQLGNEGRSRSLIYCKPSVGQERRHSLYKNVGVSVSRMASADEYVSHRPPRVCGWRSHKTATPHVALAARHCQQHVGGREGPRCFKAGLGDHLSLGRNRTSQEEISCGASMQQKGHNRRLGGHSPKRTRTTHTERHGMWLHEGVALKGFARCSRTWATTKNLRKQQPAAWKISSAHTE
ncbi:hypothetical protein DQ04_04981020 [Trypanosoma grayi]|uniref:hypothetical protein n=1 Tax=Trypanosoma grayi TaxID=71804 RepID=UPI0004F434C4|nr:hypothetical protein DQ04_04981020 [Trypanosoma grayi]KEG09588.1 hypothetical protein DQ04_04981020 [Trypanosoma grayi]